MKDIVTNYTSKLLNVFTTENIRQIEILGQTMFDVWKTKKTIFICGNGGSAGNAIHFDINDMQISEDLQLIVGHILMQWLREKAKEIKE